MERFSSSSSFSYNIRKDRRISSPNSSLKPFQLAKQKLSLQKIPELIQADCNCALHDASFIDPKGRQDKVERLNHSIPGYDADESMVVEKSVNHVRKSRRSAKREQQKKRIRDWLDSCVPEDDSPSPSMISFERKKRGCYESRREKTTSDSSLPRYSINIPSIPIATKTQSDYSQQRRLIRSQVIRPRMGLRAAAIRRRKIYFL